MKPDYKMLFLRQSYLDATEEYEKILNTNQIGNAGVKTWDYVVLTASDSRQAAAFQAQIDCRLAENRLPVKTNISSCLIATVKESARAGQRFPSFARLPKSRLCEICPLYVFCVYILAGTANAFRNIPRAARFFRLFRACCQRGISLRCSTNL